MRFVQSSFVKVGKHHSTMNEICFKMSGEKTRNKIKKIR